MNHTTNYQLTQWDRSDQVKMEDFNADNAKIDGAIAAQAEALEAEKAAREAAVQSVNSALSGRARVAAGSYTGNNSSSQTIYTGFTPKAVLVMPPDGILQVKGLESLTYCGGLAVSGSPAAASGKTIFEITSSGFQVYSGTNQSGKKYNYVAIG